MVCLSDTAHYPVCDGNTTYNRYAEGSFSGLRAYLKMKRGRKHCTYSFVNSLAKLLFLSLLLFTGQTLAQDDLSKNVEILVKQLKEGDKDQRKKAAESIEKLGPDAKAAVPALGEALKDQEPDVRYSAAQALGRMGPEARGAVAALSELLKDTNKDIRQSSAWALGRIGPEAKEAAPALLETLKDQDKDVRRTAAWALGITGTETKAAVPILMRP
jgi:HEAT repeat protein